MLCSGCNTDTVFTNTLQLWSLAQDQQAAVSRLSELKGIRRRQEGARGTFGEAVGRWEGGWVGGRYERGCQRIDKQYSKNDH